MAKLFKTNGDVIHISTKYKKFTGEEINKLVGGYIECVPLFDGNAFAFCNENGKLEHLDYNANATIFASYAGGLSLGDYFVGDVLFTSSDEVD